MLVKKSYINSKESFYFYFIIIICGISSICTQFIILREFINIFSGNELIVSVFLSNWLLLTGLGAYLGKFFKKLKNPENILPLILFGIIITPFIQILFLRLSYKTILLQGESPGFTISIVYSFFILLLYCLLHGSIFPLICMILEKFKKNNKQSIIGNIYFTDNIGNILGGLLFSFIFIFVFSNVESLLIPSLICLIGLIISFIKNKHLKIYFFLFLITIAVFFSGKFFLKEFDEKTFAFIYPNQNILDVKETKYGRIIVTKTENQYNFFENNILLFTSFDPIAREEVIHFSASQCKKIENVLLIGGGVSGAIEELLKYDPLNIDFVEFNNYIINMADKYSLYKKNEKVNIINTDGRSFLNDTKKKYDLIIIDLPDPETLQLNRFYTLEFFKITKEKLSDNGVLSFSLKSSENFLDKYLIDSDSSVYNTLKIVFKNILIIPGETHFFIASQNNLSYEIDKLLSSKNIKTKYVNKYYLNSRLSQDRINYLKNSLNDDVPINKDFKPFLFFNTIKNWSFQFGGINKWFYILFALLFLFIIIIQNRYSLIIFTTGFSGAVLEILLLITFQIIIGYMYYALGILVTIFMTGLAAGSFFANRLNINKKYLICSELYILLLILIFFIIMIFINKINNILLLNILFYLLIFLISVPVGFQFPIVVKLLKDSTISISSKLYSADLFGAYFGTLLTGVFFIPFFGFINIIILVFGIKLISLMIGIFSIKNNSKNV